MLPPPDKDGLFDSQGGYSFLTDVIFFFSKFFGCNYFFLSSIEQNFFIQTKRMGYFCVEKCFQSQRAPRFLQDIVAQYAMTVGRCKYSWGSGRRCEPPSRSRAAQIFNVRITLSVLTSVDLITPNSKLAHVNDIYLL